MLAIAALLVLVAGCGDDDAATETQSEDGTGGEPAPLVDDEIEILAIDNVFDPDDTTIEAGTTVTFRNAGRNDHNLVPADDDADWGVPTEDFGPTATATHRFTEPGTYRYYCSIHGTVDVGMTGTITVTAPRR